MTGCGCHKYQYCRCESVGVFKYYFQKNATDQVLEAYFDCTLPAEMSLQPPCCLAKLRYVIECRS